MLAEDRPLDGIRVLDLTSVVVGPVATLRLADLGAEVIKVEAPEGDLMRSLGGPSPSGRVSGKFLHFNRAKRFLCVDLKRQEGRAVIGDVLETCDVLVSNMRPEALARLGLDAETCRARKPNLIHCVITGFGPGGPYRGRAAYDSVVQGASGLAGLTLKRDGAANFAPFVVVDHVVGEITAGTISAALVRRGRTGKGATLEVPMLETMAAFVLKEHMGPATFDPPLGPPGDMRILNSDNRPVATADGWIAITANTNAQAHAFLRAIGRGELAEDDRFRTVADRFRNGRDWFGLRVEALRAHPTAYWLERFREADVPAMPCHTLETLPDDPHLSAVGLLRTEQHRTEGAITTIRPTVMMDGETAEPGRPAEQVGADTADLLAEAGYEPARIDALMRDGIVFGAAPAAASDLHRQGT